MSAPTADNATTCLLCGEPITAREMRNAAEQVTGFTLPRTAGGANQISLRQSTGRFAHGFCVRTVKLSNQATLL